MKNMNSVGWFDIFVEDMERAVEFYEKALNIHLDEMIDPSGSTQMMSFPMNMENYGAGGALVTSQYSKPGVGGSLIYFSVEDCANQQNIIPKLGGKIVRPKFSIGEFGFILLAQDTEGNMIGFNSMK